MGSERVNCAANGVEVYLSLEAAELLISHLRSAVNNPGAVDVKLSVGEKEVRVIPLCNPMVVEL